MQNRFEKNSPNSSTIENNLTLPPQTTLLFITNILRILVFSEFHEEKYSVLII